MGSTGGDRAFEATRALAGPARLSCRTHTKSRTSTICQRARAGARAICGDSAHADHPHQFRVRRSIFNSRTAASFCRGPADARSVGHVRVHFAPTRLGRSVHFTRTRPVLSARITRPVVGGSRPRQNVGSACLHHHDAGNRDRLNCEHHTRHSPHPAGVKHGVETCSKDAEQALNVVPQSLLQAIERALLRHLGIGVEGDERRKTGK